MSATLAARAHSSSRLSAPARRASPARRRSPWLARILRLVARRPGRALVVLLFAGVAGAILVNALLFQKVRHPAPIVAAPAPAQPVRQVERREGAPPAMPAAPVAVPANAPVPPSRPGDLSQARETLPRPPVAVTNVPRNAVVPPAAAPVARTAIARDPIADLINGGDIRPPAEIRGAAARPASARRTAEN
jgi:hypothetical protein